jgi:hypothetical protein
MNSLYLFESLRLHTKLFEVEAPTLKRDIEEVECSSTQVGHDHH